MRRNSEFQRLIETPKQTHDVLIFAYIKPNLASLAVMRLQSTR